MIHPDLALYLGMLLTFVAFARLPGAKALILAFVIGELVLPAHWAINYAQLPPVDKERAIWLGALLGTAVFHTRALASVRWHAADVLLLAVVLSSAYTSIDNGLGKWDALAMAGQVILSTGLPYMLGRVHLRNIGDLAYLAKVLFWGAVVYAPLAVWEFRMSPQFHDTVYGFFPHTWSQQARWGFYRPVVFLRHGLRVGAFFCTCVMIGMVLNRHRLLRWSVPLPPWLAVASVGVGLLVCMSFGPWLAVPLMVIVFGAAKRWRWVPFAAGLPGVAWLTSVFLTGSTWTWMIQPLKDIGAAGRAETLQYRLDAMAEHAGNIRQRPWFGYGGWGRGRVERWATDSEALVFLVRNGFVGAGVRYAWLFCILLAAQRAAWLAPVGAQRELLLLLACIMGIRITSGIFGVSSVYIPLELVGGAMTGLVTGVRQPRPTLQASPVTQYHLRAGAGGAKAAIGKPR
ncbi:MAG: hypothetical protein JSU63_11935 [Phycisphaerales bacterium]|nr:MAG: hypothetical protein JSU63_11935 [Phycisphaerales bacterium]